MDYGFIGGDKELLIKQVICSLLIYMIIAVIDIIKEKNKEIIEISYKKDIEPFLDDYMEAVSLPETHEKHLPFDYIGEGVIFEKLFKLLNKKCG